MSSQYRDSEGDVWMWDAHQEGYFTGDMHTALSLEDLRKMYGPLEVKWEGSNEWVLEKEETLEDLLRRVVREELDRRLGKVH